MQLAPVVSVLTKLPLILIRPTVLSTVLEGAVSIGMIHLSGSPQCAASLSDLHNDPRVLGSAFGQLGSWAGIGVMVGPLIGSTMLRAGGGSAATVYAAAMVLGLAQYAMVRLAYVESLMLSKRTRLNKLTVANPLKFLRLFQGKKGLPRAAGTLALGAALQCFAEAKNLSNINQIYNSANVGMSTAMQSNFLTGMGIAMVLAGRLARYSISTFGVRYEMSLSPAFLDDFLRPSWSKATIILLHVL